MERGEFGTWLDNPRFPDYSYYGRIDADVSYEYNAEEGTQIEDVTFYPKDGDAFTLTGDALYRDHYDVYLDCVREAEEHRREAW